MYRNPPPVAAPPLYNCRDFAAPPTFYDRATVDKIIAWQPDEARRAFFALVYGTAADVSPALIVEREDFDASAKRVRIRGTKTATRDRTARVADWAWPIVWGFAKTTIHGRVFPAAWNRWTVSDWHRQTVGDGVRDTQGDVEREGLKLEKRLPLRRARHHYAVRMLAAGVPAKLVAEQLGSDERTVLRFYGPFLPSAAD
jgi:integrase